MSYERSPRCVCSRTVGIRKDIRSPWGSRIGSARLQEFNRLFFAKSELQPLAVFGALEALLHLAEGNLVLLSNLLQLLLHVFVRHRDVLLLGNRFEDQRAAHFRVRLLAHL